MSDDENEPRDDELLGAIAESLGVIPHDEDEVARAEADGVDDVVLPDHLATWSPTDGLEGEVEGEAAPPRSKVVALDRFRRLRAAATHAVALAIGGAAAAALTLGEPAPVDPLPAGSSPSGTAAPPLLELAAPTCETPCADCPSGRRCCDVDGIEEGHFRVVLGAVQAAAAGAKVMDEYPRGEPELCVRAGVSKEVCVPTLISRRGDEGVEAPSPLLFAGADLTAGLNLRLRWKGVAPRLETAGRWAQPVALTADALCKGYLVRLTTADGEVFGRVSLLLEDAQFVELARGPDIAALKTIRGSLLTPGLEPSLVAVDGGHALVAGPLSLPTATTLHRDAIRQGIPAQLTLGTDHQGPLVPLPR